MGVLPWREKKWCSNPYFSGYRFLYGRSRRLYFRKLRTVPILISVDIGSYTTCTLGYRYCNGIVPILISVDIGSYTITYNRECSNSYNVPILISVDIGSYTLPECKDKERSNYSSNPYFSGYRFLYLVRHQTYQAFLLCSNPYFSGYRFLYGQAK